MRAVTVIPRQAGSARLDHIAESARGEGDLLVQTLAVGVCGSDLERSKVGTAGRRRAAGGWCSGTSRSAGSWRRPQGRAGAR